MQVVIGLLVFLSYFLGAKSIVKNKYRPSIYSRIIWLLLAGLGFIGNIVILLLSIKKSQKTFRKTKILSSILLSISLAVWIFTRLPLLNLSIGLIAHFIGGVPTYKKVLSNPKDEDLLFWLFFALASILTLASIDRTSISTYLYPLYFAFFDGIMVLFCVRRYNIFNERCSAKRY